jgi:raffinose/stachyose/melibiose transport system permease protein
MAAITAKISSPEILRSKRKAEIKKLISIAGFLLPGLVIYGVYNIYGIIRTFYFSTMRWTGLSRQMTFIGLENHIRAIHDSRLWLALGNNLKLVFVSIFIQITFGFILALIISSRIRGVKVFRTVFFMPMLLSTVATGILWMQMMDPYYGLVNHLLEKMNLSGLTRPWLALPETALNSVLLVICWQYTPQYMILLRAGLTNISQDIYEAATIDGANKWHQFWRITLPLMLPALEISAVLSLVGSLKYFDLIYVMTGGGPNGASELMATYLYKKGFAEANMAYASAIAVFMFIISLVLVIVFLSFTRRKQEV